MNRDEEERISFVLSRYHLRVRTGHQTLSEASEEIKEMGGRKISIDPEEGVWFLAMKPGEGTKRTPERSHLMCPSSAERA